MSLKLTYVNKIGFDYKNNGHYEFLFTDTDITPLEDVWGEGWEIEPAYNNCEPPSEEYIDTILKISVHEYELHTIDTNETFSVMDATHGVIALAYEDMDDRYPYDERLVFHYGEDIDNIESKFTKRKINYKLEEV